MNRLAVRAALLGALLFCCCSPLRLRLSIYNGDTVPVNVRIGTEIAQKLEPGKVLTSLRPMEGQRVEVEGGPSSAGAWKVGEPELPLQADSEPALLIVGSSAPLAAAVLDSESPAKEGAEKPAGPLAIREVVDLRQTKGYLALPGYYRVVGPRDSLPTSLGRGEGVFRLVELSPATESAAQVEQEVRERVGAELSEAAKPSAAKPSAP
ncbi:MAG: hypothetical protein HY319_10080 [Armatimonadetes bacterium]|nr:hypothetical protein [Armatimonadota bacterium]